VLPLLAAERAAAAMSFGKAGFFGGKGVVLAGTHRIQQERRWRGVSGGCRVVGCRQGAWGFLFRGGGATVAGARGEGWVGLCTSCHEVEKSL